MNLCPNVSVPNITYINLGVVDHFIDRDHIFNSLLSFCHERRVFYYPCILSTILEVLLLETDGWFFGSLPNRTI